MDVLALLLSVISLFVAVAAYAKAEKIDRRRGGW
jgi:hypothetical protein